MPISLPPLVVRTLCLIAVLASGPTAAAAKCTGADLLPKLAASHPAIMAEARKGATKFINTGAIFWQVAKPGRGPSHLFGTMHVADPRITDQLRPAEKALMRSKVLAVEIANMSSAATRVTIAKFPELMVYTDGTRLEDKLTAAEFKQARALLTRAGVPKPTAQLMRPWMISSLLAVPECEHNRIARGWSTLDAYIEGLAKTKAIPVIGLETVEFQLRTIASLPDDDQVAILRLSLAYLEDREDIFETMIQAYMRRDLGIMLSLSDGMARAAGLKSSGFAAFNRDFLENRNHTMFASSRPLVEKGGAFIAVGAAHLFGETGLVALYRKAGFTVTAIN